MKLTPIILAAMLLAAPATAADRVIPTPHGDDALIIPDGSPVRLKEFQDYGAQFTGQVTLTGTFILGCPDECELPLAEGDLALYFAPDPEQAKRLPHWREHNNDMRVLLYPTPPLDAISAERRDALIRGDIDQITVRASVIIDEFSTSLDCDSATFAAHFVAFKEPPVVQEARLDGAYGCG